MDYEEIFERLFKTKNIDEELRKLDSKYLNALFDDNTLTYEKLILFINKHKSELIECALNDNSLIYDILSEDRIVDTTRKQLITKEYLENLINKINNKEFDSKTITLYLYIMQIHNLFVDRYDENTLKEILKLNLLSILNKNALLSKEGRNIFRIEEKKELADKLITWNIKCGKKILPYIFQLETLKEYITTLLNSNEVKNSQDYKRKLSNLLKICEYGIVVRDTDVIPTKEEVEQINNLFDNYDLINKSILIDALNKDSVRLVHFIRDNEVDYQLVGNDIIDMSNKKNNEYDLKQAEFFINSYYEYIKSAIEKQTGKRFDINNFVMRLMLKKCLDYYNRIINYRPLDRMPIKKRETGSDFREYIRETDGRLSCSLISSMTEEPPTHLDRKIGLIIRPKREAIISTSLGYTSEKDFYDFKNDSVPCTEIFERLGTSKFVNETCVDVSKCEVVGVLLLSDEKDVVKRAKKIAEEYNAKIIRLINGKIDAQRKSTKN